MPTGYTYSDVCVRQWVRKCLVGFAACSLMCSRSNGVDKQGLAVEVFDGQPNIPFHITTRRRFQ